MSTGADAGSTDDRLWRLLTAFGLVAFAGFAFYYRQTAIFWGGDDADYALLAQAVRGLRYHDLFLVGIPPHTTYPPVYPVLLSMWGGALGDGVSTLSALNVLLMVAALGIVAHLVTIHSSARVAALITLVLVTNPHLLTYAGRMMSEAPMMFFAASAIWFADRRSDRAGIALAIACAVLCALTRTAGVAVIVAIGLHWLFRRRWAAAAALGIAAVIGVGGWLLWTVQETADPSAGYASRFAAYQLEEVSFVGALVEAIVTKARVVFASQLPEAFALPLTDRTQWDNLVWAPLLIGAIGLGLWSMRKRSPVAMYYLLAYALVLGAWPFTGMRLLFPILPLLVTAAIVGAWRAGGFISPRLAEPLAIVTAVILVGGGAWRSAQDVPCDGSVYSETPNCVRESDVGLGQAITFVGEQTARDAVIMVRRGEVLHYYTHRLTVGWPSPLEARSVPPDTILAYTQADYIVASQAYTRTAGLATFLDRTCERLETVYAIRPHTLVLRVHPAEAPPDEPACRDVREGFPPIE